MRRAAQTSEPEPTRWKSVPRASGFLEEREIQEIERTLARTA